MESFQKRMVLGPSSRKFSWIGLWWNLGPSYIFKMCSKWLRSCLSLVGRSLPVSSWGDSLGYVSLHKPTDKTKRAGSFSIWLTGVWWGVYSSPWMVFLERRQLGEANRMKRIPRGSLVTQDHLNSCLRSPTKFHFILSSPWGNVIHISLPTILQQFLFK